MNRLAFCVLILASTGACGRDAEGPDEPDAYLPIVDAPLDTVHVIETVQDTGLVASSASSALRDPGWIGIDPAGLPDLKQLRYVRYRNPRFRYSIAYPDTLLKPAEPVGEVRGMEFTSAQKDVRMLVFGVETSTREDLDAQYRAALGDPDAAILYRARDDNWYIVSGIKNDEVFYEKSIAGEGILKTFRIQYPLSKKAYYDAVTAVMSASFE